MEVPVRGGVGVGARRCGGRLRPARRVAGARTRGTTRGGRRADAAREGLVAFIEDVGGVAASVDPLLAWRAQSVVEAHPLASAAAGVGLAAAAGAAVRSVAAAPSAPLPEAYDIEAIKAYWVRRPLAASRRGGVAAAKILAWGARLAADVAAGTVDANAPARAREVRDIIAGQGAAFVKVGQALAIRPDVLPPAYASELQALLDQVQAFDAAEARELLAESLGRPLGDVFEDAEAAFERPVAAASIGQVYKARLKGSGDLVAVKVQRPNLLETVTIDLLTLRSLGELFAALPGPADEPTLKQVRSNAESFLAVVDTAAARFLEELDFRLEASNAARFEREMGAVDVVRGIIKVPRVYEEFSSREVIVQEWVDGKKLTALQGDDSSEGVEARRRVVTKLLNSYMVQLLQTGFLHADPHPGNFLVLDDGRLCIMDYGMVTEVSEDQRLAFVEYLAHLSAGQYEETLGDLVKLGFVSPDLQNDPEKRAIVAPVLAETLSTLYSEGGGLDKKVDKLQAQSDSRVGEIGDKLEELSKEYPIALPPYFVLILRAFGTLEGLGLGIDDDFAVVDECFPYIARRMLSDDSPRMRAALRTFLYGGSDRLNVERVESLVEGFASFTNSMDAEAEGRLVGRRSASPAAASSTGLDASTRDAIAILFSAEGNYLQTLVVEEAVRAVDALSRNAAVLLWQQLATSAPLTAPLGLLPTALVPGLNALPLLSAFAARNADAVSLTLDDRRNLVTLRRLQQVVAGLPPLPAGETSTPTPEQIRDAQAAIQTAAPGLQRMGNEFLVALTQRLALRVREDAKGLGLVR